MEVNDRVLLIAFGVAEASSLVEASWAERDRLIRDGMDITDALSFIDIFRTTQDAIAKRYAEITHQSWGSPEDLDLICADARRLVTENHERLDELLGGLPIGRWSP